MADDYIDVSGVDATDVAKVLTEAAGLLAQQGWTPSRSNDERLTVLQAITQACDTIAGRGVDTAELHTAALDAVCLHVFGVRHGMGKSVSGWERQVAARVTAEAIRAQTPDIMTVLFEAAS